MRIIKNRTMLGIICIIFALVICFVITPLVNKGISDKTEIVRVVKDINIGDRIEENMVKVVKVGSYNLPSNIMNDISKVVGTYANASFTNGDYIINTKISKKIGGENNYLYNLDGKNRAISISIKDLANGVSGKLQSGDIVSVIAADYRNSGTTVIPSQLTYVKVIGVTTAEGLETNTSSSGKNEEERTLPSTVTLLANQQQSKILAELEKDGNCHLALVYRGDKARSDQFLQKQAKAMKSVK